MTSAPLYLYGIVPAVALQGDDETAGVNGAKVGRLSCDDLAVLVSAADGGPVARTRRNLLAHTSVLERVLPHTTVLPLRFGTVVPDAATLTACIAANRTAFRSAMRDIDGQFELGVKAVWRRGMVFTDIVERDHSLRQLRDRLRARPASDSYYERIELGRRVEAALAERRDVVAAAILEDLLPLAEQAAELRLLDDDMVLNRAFLVRRDQERQFDAAVQALADRFADRMEFRYVGPVPPFNFVTLHAAWLTMPAEAAVI